jgi:hypothetical protein
VAINSLANSQNIGDIIFETGIRYFLSGYGRCSQIKFKTYTSQRRCVIMPVQPTAAAQKKKNQR